MENLENIFDTELEAISFEPSEPADPQTEIERVFTCCQVIDGSKCERKVKSFGETCRKCKKQAQVEEEEKKKEEFKVSNKEKVVNALFGMQLAVYLNIEMISSFWNVDLKGLPQDLIEQRDIIMSQYNLIYDEYGPETLMEQVGPVYALALMSAGQIGSRYVNNKKKVSED